MIVSQVTGNDTVSSLKDNKIFTDVNTNSLGVYCDKSLKILELSADAETEALVQIIP